MENTQKKESGFILKEKEDYGKKERELLPAGIYNAVCVQLINLGTQKVNYPEKPVMDKKRVWMTFEVFGEKMKDDKPFFVSKEFTFSFHEKSTLRKHLISWRGKQFTDEELKHFNLISILGLACQINVIHTINSDPEKIWANLNTILPKYKNFKFEKTVNEILSFDINNVDETVLAKLPEFIQKKIKLSPEWEAYQNQKIKSEDESLEMEDENLDEEIPF
jgi:hypothetical protein